MSMQKKIIYLEKTMELMKETMNSILVDTDLSEFWSYERMPSPVMAKAKDYLKEQAEKRMQDVAFKNHGNKTRMGFSDRNGLER